MVDGSFRCLGTSQHLKSKYGRGYQIEATYKSEDQFEDFMALCRNISPELTVEEKHGQFIRLKVSS